MLPATVMLASAAAAEGTPSLPASLSPALELLPAAPLDRQLYCNASLQTWGGNVLEDDAGGFHLYAAGFGTGNCGLNEWLTNSDVIHAVSDSPDGPFSYRDTAVPLWAHNPQAIRAPDGKWLLYQIARRNCQPRYTWKIPFCNESKKERLPCPPGAKPAGNTTAELCAALGSRPRDPNCHGSSAPECHCDSHRIEIYSADSPNGPWSRFTPSPDLYDGSIVAYGANPAPIFLPNGSIAVVQTSFGYNPALGFTGALRVAVAQSWNSSYRNDLHLPFAPCHFCTEPPCLTCADCANGTLNGKNLSGCGNLEDPVIWFDQTAQRYKLLAHSFDGDGDSGDRVGAYAQSKTADLFGPWDFDLHAGAYGMSAQLEDCSTLTFKRRERPKVFLARNGSVHSVSNGVQLPDGRVCTFVQKVRQATEQEDNKWHPRSQIRPLSEEGIWR